MYVAILCVYWVKLLCLRRGEACAQPKLHCHTRPYLLPVLLSDGCFTLLTMQNVPSPDARFLLHTKYLVDNGDLLRFRATCTLASAEILTLFFLLFFFRNEPASYYMLLSRSLAPVKGGIGWAKGTNFTTGISRHCREETLQ